jgi:hypothetical protein
MHTHRIVAYGRPEGPVKHPTYEGKADSRARFQTAKPQVS